MTDKATVHIEGDDSPLKRTLAHSTQMLTNWASGPVNAITKWSEGRVYGMLGGTSFRSLLGSFARATFPTFGGLAAFAAVQTGAEKLVEFGKTAMEVAENFEQASIKLNSVLRSTANAIQLTPLVIERLTTRMRNVQNIPKPQGTEVLARFAIMENIRGPVLERAVGLVGDFAKALRKEPVEAAKSLAIALNNPIHGLLRLHLAGIRLEQGEKQRLKYLQEAGKLEQAQIELLAILERKIGGVAAAERLTPSGQWTAFKLKFEERIVNFGQSLEDAFVSLIPVAELLAEILVPALEIFGTALAGVGMSLGEFAKSIVLWVKEIDRSIKFVTKLIPYPDYPEQAKKMFQIPTNKERQAAMDRAALITPFPDVPLGAKLNTEKSIAGTFEKIEDMWQRISSAGAKDEAADAIEQAEVSQSQRDQEQINLAKEQITHLILNNELLKEIVAMPVGLGSN